MKIVVYLPNLTKSSGGAEVYGLLMASALTQKYDVTILTERPKNGKSDVLSIFRKYNVEPIPTDYYDYLKLWINRYTEVVRRNREFFVNRYLKEHPCDLFINGTYGKLVLKKGIKGIHVIHFPAEKGKGILGRARDRKYINSYNEFLANSEFTKRHFQKFYGRTADVLTPPIAMDVVAPSQLKNKERIILAVDRIVPDKCLLEMISAFRQLVDEGRKDLKFVIIGNTDVKEKDYYQKVLDEKGNYPIEILSDAKYEELLSWYKKALIFWHAKGYGVSNENPLNMEHFGMTTVEAMKNGCIPVVINKAGPKEVVERIDKSLLWDDLDELKRITSNLLDDSERIRELQALVLKEAENYQMSVFESKVLEMVGRNV